MGKVKTQTQYYLFKLNFDNDFLFKVFLELFKAYV